ncbi:MAG: TRAP transporter small permease subunit [Tranquillimonas sp.]|jgi:TRAP-type mannitol/chloroaromatic compound transport system permease small subunit
MPELSFTLPHWLYWVGLIVFPLIAMALARRPVGPRKYSIPLGYLILVTGGMIGLHRFYLKSLLGLVYIPIFLLILIANSQANDARSVLSDVQNEVRVAERMLERERPRLEEAQAALPDIQAELDGAEEGSFTQRSAERRLERTKDTVTKAEARIAEAEGTLTSIGTRADDASSARNFWLGVSQWSFYLILALLLIDAVLLPGMVRRANANIPAAPPETMVDQSSAAPGEDVKDDRDLADNWIDRLALFAGEFVAYWAVIAVFAYYYEVIARYVFNSPTNWAHEAMYLMFGMQYLIAGSYAMLTESHVRVDIFYAPLPRRKRAWVDLLTSVFFFIFAGTLLVTSWIFAMDAIAVPSGNSVISDWARGQISLGEAMANWNLGQWTDPSIRWGEISFNEWEVPLWPMKWVMVLGGLLLVLQGVSKVGKDIRAIARGE